MRMSDLLKFECYKCYEQFLVNESKAKKHKEKGLSLVCPYCKGTVSAVAGTGDDELDLGCLGIYDYELKEE